MRFVDSNVLLRALTGDHPRQTEQCRRFFRRVAAGIEVTTSEAIIVEVVYVLASSKLYAVDRRTIGDRLARLLSLRGWQLPDLPVYLEALDLFAAHPRMDFPDALAVAHMRSRGITTILSYDRDFDRVEGVAREEP